MAKEEEVNDDAICHGLVQLSLVGPWLGAYLVSTADLLAGLAYQMVACRQQGNQTFTKGKSRMLAFPNHSRLSASVTCFHTRHQLNLQP